MSTDMDAQHESAPVPTMGNLFSFLKNKAGANDIYDAAMLIDPNNGEKERQPTFKEWIESKDAQLEKKAKAEGFEYMEEHKMDFILRAYSDRYYRTSCIQDRDACKKIINSVYNLFFHPYARELNLVWETFYPLFRCSNKFWASYLCKQLKELFTSDMKGKIDYARGFFHKHNLTIGDIDQLAKKKNQEDEEEDEEEDEQEEGAE
ncbi:hypothetical protein CYMTET_7459 [Cymbomonas tetramitiformis]|uniref:Uncharacterized protein n=1 Tax=Cymbomonas tetramitiformis TaxID=36881 RepID=A0AAE0GV31_9CHLO|nr:hypothetical protein CYMTET_7459 [Cymbomonas tetramitiformis]